MEAETNLQLNPAGSLLQSVAGLLSLQGELKDGYLRVESTQPLRGLEVILEPVAMSAINGRGGERPVGKLWAPHFFASSDGGITRLRLANLGDGPAALTIRAFDDEGEAIGEPAMLSLEPKELRILDLTQALRIDASDIDPGQVLTGYLEVEFEDSAEGSFFSSPFVLAVVSYEGAFAQMLTTLPLLADPVCSTLYQHVAQSPDGGVFHGLAILNANGSSSTVNVQAFDRQGAKTAQKEILIASRHRVLGLLSDDTYFGPEFEQVNGYLLIESDLPLLSYSIFGGARFLAAIEGQVPNR